MYGCAICDKIFKQKDLLTQHIQMHGEPKLVCHHCGCKFKWRQSLGEHIKHCKYAPPGEKLVVPALSKVPWKKNAGLNPDDL